MLRALLVHEFLHVFDVAQKVAASPTATVVAPAATIDAAIGGAPGITGIDLEPLGQGWRELLN